MTLREARGNAHESMSLARTALVVWRSLRPEFWLVCIFPMYMGYVIAARQPFPDVALWQAVWTQALTTGVDLGVVAAATGRWFAGQYAFVFAILCMGPLIWGSTLLFNDVCDLAADVSNPRRSETPLVRALLSPRTAMRLSVALAIAGLALAALISPVFLALMAACLALSWAYSSPPLRLKGRAGFDLLVNVFGIGVLCTLAGWSLAAPLEAFPFPYLLQPILLLASAYVPTTMVDEPFDREYGFDTIAVRLGIVRAWWLGLAFVLAANALYALTAWFDYVVTWRVFEVTWPLVVLETVAYAVGFYPWNGRLPTRRAFVAIAAAGIPFGLGQAIFIAHYTGALLL